MYTIYKSEAYGPAFQAFKKLAKNFREYEFIFEPLGHSDWETYGPWSVSVGTEAQKDVDKLRKFVHDENNTI